MCIYLCVLFVRIYAQPDLTQRRRCCAAASDRFFVLKTFRKVPSRFVCWQIDNFTIRYFSRIAANYSC